MCLAFPGKIIKINKDHASVDFGGIVRDINILLVDDIKIGDYVNVHAGFAVQKMTRKDANEVLKLFSENAGR